MNALPEPNPYHAIGPFHDGEREAQLRAGVADVALTNGSRGIRDHMPDQHRAFFAMLPFMVFGGVDASGQPWATLRANTTGFVSTPDSRTLRIEGGALPGDPLEGRWVPGARIGGLGIQPHTRRRNRVNGVIEAVDGNVVTLAVQQSFGNCPKYINGREPTFVGNGLANASVEHADSLSEEDRALIARADAFFIASANLDDAAAAGRGVDVSHRGGVPGFVRIDDERTLTAPDFTGNNFFNTIGNLLREPRAGLLFVDFERGDLLYLAVRAEVIWDGPEVAQFPMAQRLVRFHLHEVRRVRGALPLRWTAVEYAPQFEQVLNAAPKKADAPAWRTLRVADVRDESPTIRSFSFEPADSQPLAPFEAGQYLPLRVGTPGSDKPLMRTYTLSAAHDAAHPARYRISVKRDGAVSRWLHEHARIGAPIETLAPRGSFKVDLGSPRAIVLAAAGIGITPMLAMLDAALALEPQRRIHVFHGTRGEHERPFAAVLRAIEHAHPNVSVHLYDSAAQHDSPAGDRLAGRVNIDALRRFLLFDDYDFYLCGPEAFMRDLYNGLRALNIADERIRFEAFGPSTLKRKVSETSPIAGQPTKVIPVTFSRTGTTVNWEPQQGSLLDTAERGGVNAASNCRSGMCGTCAARVLHGSVEYDESPEFDVEPGHALICVGHPAAGGVTLDL
ncbi:pyridoxamine 5'-phosphate oxidase family protein [Paraburkholderia acidiphila]|uniref:2Fe-2S iron-sulfur cluster binding domain-containing protein n=1 Tax=Paraburkholderia acidiphila TaxID=2571747 RepID=A0A7Z2GC27_9BURK|nr:pyridoxamine 5'-phosphate oxidase family protein [Paraburkholderia acidiphila]QGZ58891.1 2Fe-2S iron-sulfur cluster binding domain-containing protein [Paraburkholderia acidiphila]